MDKRTARTWAEVDLNALENNLRVAQKKTGKKVMCVIKGDAHGHGAAECGAALEAAGADAFGVAALSEAVELRQSGVTRPILILGWTPPEFAGDIIDNGLSQSVMDEDYARELSAAAKAHGGTLSVHVKLDSGMCRTGIVAHSDHAAAASAVCRIDALESLRIDGIFTHFAVADVDTEAGNGFTAWQLANYKAVLGELAKQGFTREVIHHCGNSATILFHPEAYFDMVRAGVMLYGLSPTNYWDFENELQPVLSLKSRVAQVKTLPKGAKVSYGCTYETTKETKVAVMAAGYADAYPRTVSNKGAYAVINGHRCPQIGRICMDMCMFDATGADVKQGDEAILYGAGGMSMEELTNLVGTINCEPTCLLTKRVQRVYVRK